MTGFSGTPARESSNAARRSIVLDLGRPKWLQTKRVALSEILTEELAPFGNTHCGRDVEPGMSTAPTKSEDARDLAEFVSTRSAGAFERLATRYANLVFAACSRRLGNREDAEDASQAVFAALAMKAAKVKARYLISWLHGTAMRTAAYVARTRARRARHEEEAARMKSSTAERPPEPTADPVVLRAHLDAEIVRLPTKLREAMMRHYLTGQSHAELARDLGIPEGTAASRVSAGLEKLRARLAGRGAGLGAAALGAALTAEAGTAAPASLLSSLPAIATAASAAGAGAGAGAAAVTLAKGVLKMLFWEKIKLTAAAVLCAGAVAGLSGVALEARSRAGAEDVPQPVAGENPRPILKAGPAVASTARVLKGRVTYVKNGKVYISLGNDHGVKKGFKFTCRAKGWTGTVVDYYVHHSSILSVTGGKAEPGDEVQTGYTEILATLEKNNSRDRKPGQPGTAKPQQVKGLDLTLRVAGTSGCGWFCETPRGKIIDNVAHVGHDVPDGSKLYFHYNDKPSLSIRNNGTKPRIVSTDLSKGCRIRSFLKDLFGRILVTSEWTPRELRQNELPKVSVLMPGQVVKLQVPLHARPDVNFKSGVEKFDRKTAASARRSAERTKKFAEGVRKRGIRPIRGWGKKISFKTLPRGWYLLSVEVDLGSGGEVAGGAKLVGGKIKTEDVFIHLGARSKMMGIKKGRGVKDREGRWIFQ
jgi:RNA polymerase sigma factor (sigma-70 family)